MKNNFSFYDKNKKHLMYAPNNRTIEVPEGVEYITNEAFKNALSAEVIVLPESLEFLEPGCFMNLKNLQKINIPHKIKEIPIKCFIGCDNLKSIGINLTDSVIIHNNISKINFSAFDNCRNLESAILPDSLIELENNAFDNCPSFNTLEINENATIGADIVSKNSPFYINNNIEGYLVINDTLTVLPLAKNFEIPPITNIGSVFAFKTIEDIILPKTVKKLGNKSFINSQINSINLNYIEEFGAYSFFNTHIKNYNINCPNAEILHQSCFEESNIIPHLSNKIKIIFPYALNVKNRMNTLYFSKDTVLHANFIPEYSSITFYGTKEDFEKFKENIKDSQTRCFIEKKENINFCNSLDELISKNTITKVSDKINILNSTER